MLQLYSCTNHCNCIQAKLSLNLHSNLKKEAMYRSILSPWRYVSWLYTIKHRNESDHIGDLSTVVVVHRQNWNILIVVEQYLGLLYIHSLYVQSLLLFLQAMLSRSSSHVVEGKHDAHSRHTNTCGQICKQHLTFSDWLPWTTGEHFHHR